jgi:hypothetical protein
MNRDKVVQAEQRLRDTVLLMMNIRVEDLPDKYRAEFNNLYEGICDLWEELCDEIYPEEEEE